MQGLLLAFCLATGQPPAKPCGKTVVYDHGDQIYDVDFSFQQGLIVVTAKNELTLVDLKTRKPVGTINHNGRPMSGVCVSPCGQFVACGCFFGDVAVFSLKTREAIFNERRIHSGMVCQLAYSPNGSRLASAAGGIVRIWDVKKGTPITRIETDTDSMEFSFGPGPGQFAASCSSGVLQIWSLETEKLVKEAPITKNRVFSSRFLPEAKTFVTVGHDSSVKWWDLDSFALKKSATDADGDALSFVDVSPDQRHVAICGKRFLTVLKKDSNEVICRIPCPADDTLLLRPVFSPDRQTLYFFSRAGRVYSINIPDAEREPERKR